MRKNIRQNWQILWDHSSKGKQVKKLSDKVGEERMLGDFYLNQIITDHRAFKTYQNRFFGKSPWCFCGKDEGTVEHLRNILSLNVMNGKTSDIITLKKNSSSIKELLQDSQSRKGMKLTVKNILTQEMDNVI
ncbi:hypothetical protein AVEN_232468-1 [Araneus ventricosus]|uniref:Uncharacterized protein n=1 Tax=Araneus ventricosus TaxID=182803 RepID=A0A4Y2EBU9_ARAVE|nr:hypothetical protein AVEN_232468-1 [Araneus ventricosus]